MAAARCYPGGPCLWAVVLALLLLCRGAAPAPVSECTGRTLIVAPLLGMGLNNQLDIVVNALFAGIVTRRRVCVGGFAPHFQSRGIVPIDHVLDLQRMNEDLVLIPNSSLGIAVASPQAIAKSTCLLLPVYSGAEAPSRCEVGRLRMETVNPLSEFATRCPKADHGEAQDVLCYLSQDAVSAKAHLLLSNGSPLKVRTPEAAEHQLLLARVYRAVRFHPQFYAAVRSIRKRNSIRDGERYSAVHLRVEDDWLKWLHWQYRRNLFKRNTADGTAAACTLCANRCHHRCAPMPVDDHNVHYLTAYLRFLQSHLPTAGPMFVISGIGKGGSPQRAGFVVPILRKLFPGLISPKKSAPPKGAVFAGREMMAILDFILAQEASHFGGMGASTFSKNVKRQLARPDAQVHMLSMEAYMNSTIHGYDPLLPVHARQVCMSDAYRAAHPKTQPRRCEGSEVQPLNRPSRSRKPER